MEKMIRRIVLLCVLFLGWKTTQAQTRGINVTFSVTPPYSSKLSDYGSLPGKTIITLTNPVSATGAPARVYLRLTITGDNGIKISTKAGYRPSQPILVQPNVPTLVDLPTINALFDANTFDLVGITARQIITKEGLPEGNYQLCVRAYNYDTPDLPASGEAPAGCIFIRLTQLEPPLLIKPFDKENISMGASAVQNIIFSWNIPAGSEPGTQYLLRVIEMLDPNKNPNDAMNSKTTPAFFETVTNSNIFLYGPAQSALVPGRKYAWAVTASPYVKESGYRNGGRSEVRSFVYNGTTTVVGNAQLSFLFPNSKNAIATVNNQNDLVLTWNWLNNLAVNQTVTDTAYKKYGVDKYDLEISAASETKTQKIDKDFPFKATIAKNNDTLSHLFKRTEAEAGAMGFKDGYWYKATITAKGINGNTIQTAVSVPFQYSKSTDEEPVFTTKVKAQLKYAFEGKPGQYNASNTPVEIQALSKTNNIPIPGKAKELINGSYYNVIATASQETNATGDLEVNVMIPQSKVITDSFYYRIKMNGAYYLYNHFGLLATKAVKKDTSVNFGQQVAKTYGYSLKLNVSKAYPSYFVKTDANGNLQINVDTASKFSSDFTYDGQKGGMTYKSNQAKPQAGLTLIVYRKNKKQYVPPVEGSLSAGALKTGYVEVSREKTQLEKAADGTDQAVVQFNNLLANLFEGDEYYVMALNAANKPLSDAEFMATEMVVKVPRPLNVNKPDSLYRTIKYNYTIISKKAPTSLVKGKLLYKWESEGTKAQLRPASNQKFTVVVDYLVDGASINSVKQNTSNAKKIGYSEKFFVPEGQDEYNDGQQLLDFGQTMATGKTDAQGNFEIEVVNFNKKGSLGKGSIVEQGWSADKPDPKTKPNTSLTDLKETFANPVINPYDGLYNNMGTYNSMPGGNYGFKQTDLFNSNSQGALNAGVNGGFGLNTANGFFEAGVSAGISVQVNVGFKGISMVQHGIEQKMHLHGPAVEDEPMQDRFEPTQKVERVYRIIPDNEYLYPANETFAVQAFEAASLPASNSPVKETTIKVTTRDKGNNTLSGMLVTIFRPLGQKTPDMPFGEGDGKYLQKELTNPQYKAGSADATFNDGASGIKNGNVFGSKYEILTPEQVSASDGSTTIRHVLMGYPYYFMACSNPTDGAKFYKATFTQSSYKEAILINLEPLASRALIRTKDNSTQKPLPITSVYVNNKYVNYTDYEGYLELKDPALPGLNASKGTTLSFYAKANGYKKSPESSYTFNLLGSQFVKDLNLDPAGLVTGNLVSKDEKNKPVKAFIKSGAGKTVETDNNGNFSIPVPALGNEKLEIIPKDVAYFDSTLTVSLSGTVGNINKKDIPIYRRKHRIIVHVRNIGTKSNIPNAIVQLGDSTKTANVSGEAKFEFENVSVNNYTFIIKGNKNSNYIPVTKNVKNEESKSFTEVLIELEKGSEVTGTVTLDNKSVKNAKVYVEASNKNSGNDKDANLLITYTDAQGKYTLHGVPVNNSKINIIATLDTSFTVNGDNKVADITNNTAVTNLALTSYTGMAITNVFGFPLSVEKITPTGNADEVKVTGVIRWTNAISDFKWIQGNDILRVEDVVFKAKTVNGKKIGEVQDASVAIEDATSFKLRYLNKYNVKLSKKQGLSYPGSVPNPLSITKENDYGVIKGNINIVDNSFNYPSTYINFTQKDQFYLATVGNNTVSTTVSAVTSVMKASTANNGTFANYHDLKQKVDDILAGNNSSSQASALYNISNSTGGNISFKFIEFDATADAAKSFIAKDGKIHLNIRMKCKVPNAQPDTFSVNVSDVVLDDNKVYASSSSSPLEVTLEKWTLLVKNWELSPQQGGIVSTNGLIRTSKLDIPFKTFNLRSDMFLIDDFQLNDLKIGGGIKSLSNINSSNASLVYDNKTGTDMKPHWRFSMSSTGTPVATLTDLPDLGGQVGIDYIQLLSNEQNIFQLKQAASPLLLYGNSIAKFSPQSIGNGPDFFTINGALNIGAPHSGDMQMELKFTKPSGVLKMKTGNVKTDIEGKGFVHFTSVDGINDIANITINKNEINIRGNVVEKPSKSFNPIPASLIALTTGPGVATYKVDLDKNYVLQLTSEGSSASSGYKLTIDKGSMEVVNNDWDILTYSGTMASNSGGADNGVKPMYVTFKVLGDINVDGSGAKMDNINTPFGAMTMVYQFPSRLVGTLKLDKVQLGTNLISGTVETVFDPKGFYVAGGGSADIITGNPIVDGTYNLGFMIGSYPLATPGDQLWKTVTAYKQAEVKNDCFVGKLGGKLKGFYMTADRIVLDKSADFDFILVSGYVQAKAIIGADLYANFSGSTAMGVAAYVYAHGAAGMSAITGTSMSGSADARAAAIMEYAGNKFNLDVKIDVSFTATVKQFVVLGTLSASKSVGASATAGTSGFSLDLNGGNKLPECY